MKKIIFVLIVCFSFLRYDISSAADTLRHYNPAVTTVNVSSAYQMYIARFEPLGPGYINKLIVTLGGLSDNGTATVHLFGHDGGTAFPQWQEDLITPVVINKTQSGFETIAIDLNKPVWIDNNQFFVAISDVSSGVLTAATSEPPAASCKSSNGGDYYYMFFHNPGASSPWILGSNKTLKIDAIMDYATTTPKNYMVDVTLSAGLPDNLSNKDVAWADFNKDNALDLLVRDKLFKNNNNGTFTDVTTAAGITTAKYTMFADMNNDGWVDILSLGDSAENILYTNNHDGTFTPNAFNTGFSTFGPLKAISIADVNKDKYPDFFTARLWTTYGQSDSAFLFYNNGDSTFADSTQLLFPTGINGNCRGSIWVDYDNDGHLDLYIVNYVTQTQPPRDRFFRNNGDGSFTDVIGQTPLDNNNSSGNPFYNMSSGVDFGDYDNDGDMDVLLPTLAHPHHMKPYDVRPTTIFSNSGAPNYSFTDMRNSHNLQYEETHAGSTWGDVDNDGLLDIVTTAFYGCRYIDLYLQQPDHSYKMETFDFGLKDVVTGEDAIWVDFNNDGYLDLSCGADNKFRLYQSKYPHGKNWVEFDLECTTGNSQGIGARITVYTPAGNYMREVTAGKGQMMQHPARAHFGLGYATIDSVIVRWPDSNSTVTTYTNLTHKRIYLLKQDGTADVLSVARMVDDNIDLKVYPNPMNEDVHFSFNLQQPQYVEFAIYTAMGEKVADIKAGDMEPGAHTLSWNKNNGSKVLVPGIYYYKIQLGSVNKSGTIVVQ